MKIPRLHEKSVLTQMLGFAAIFILPACGPNTLPDRALTVDEIAIEVKGASREVGYTNKEAGFLYTESNGEYRSGWQGWHVFAQKLLDDYQIRVDGSPLAKSTVRSARVAPDRMTREYGKGITETIVLLDSIDALIVDLHGVEGRRVEFSPLFGSPSAASNVVRSAYDGALSIGLNVILPKDLRAAPPAWLDFSTTSPGASSDTVSAISNRRYSPGSIRIASATADVRIIITAEHSAASARTLAACIAREADARIEQRRDRMQRCLDEAVMRSTNERFDRAMAWAVLSMDALIMNQVRKGIFAGLPWFNNYWGRDSFISLAGATLVTGRTDDAREILRSFAGWQETDAKSANEGRIPNLVTTASLSYNTADGTPWFVSALREFISVSGDTAFGRSLYPVVKRSIEGTLRHHTDRNRFLVHGDAETWMDAVGPEGPWSPRGDRACDIQSLWVKQLLDGAALARNAGDELSAERWESIVDTVLMNFQRLFIDAKRNLIFDHLNRDGSPDIKLRPNQLFALDIVQDASIRTNVFRTVTERLVYPHGVGSLSPDDEDFHPFHHFEPKYPQDAAYHQGIVWTWLYGPWVQAATGFGLADLSYQVTENMLHQILDRGAVGTLSELLDAAPRPGESEPRLSGTFSQAWSLAEFIRTACQSYMGIHVNAPDRQVTLTPCLPSQLRRIRCFVPMGSERISLEYESDAGQGIVRIGTDGCRAPVTFLIAWRFEDGAGRRCSMELQPDQYATVTLTPDSYEVTGTGDKPASVESAALKLPSYASLEGIHLASPSVPPNLKALKEPGHRLLTNAEIKRENRDAKIVFDRDDPAGDDRGPEAYTYPASAYFQPGCLDLTRFRCSVDDSLIYFYMRFRDLADPGWHPEYGFQLTFAALCIDVDGASGSGRTVVGRNSEFVLPRSRAAEYVIFVGGGIRIENADGAVLAEYTPIAGDEHHPLGSSASDVISFAIPRTILAGNPASWKLSVLIGAQDDHGGAGIGDFRSVTVRAGEWTGGGKHRASESNIYDTMFE